MLWEEKTASNVSEKTEDMLVIVPTTSGEADIIDVKAKLITGNKACGDEHWSLLSIG